MTETKQKSMIGQVFLISLITATLIFLPAIIWDKGYFLFLGDFNSQQIPFYKTAHAAVRSGILDGIGIRTWEPTLYLPTASTFSGVLFFG